MERPYALWAALLALVPWLLLLLPPTGPAPEKIPFPAMRLLAAPNLRPRRRRRRILRAALRSAAFAALAVLWASPDPDALLRRPAAAPEADPAAAAALRSVLIVDGSDPGAERRSAFSPADYLALAFGAQFDDLRVDRIAALDFAARPDAALRSCDALVAVNLDALAPEEEAAVARFLAHGGTALIWSGSRTLTDRWNATFRRWNLDASVTDVLLDPRAGAPIHSHGSHASDAERLFLNAFPGGSSARLDALPARRVFSCDGPDATVFLRDRDSGRPTFTGLRGRLCWFGVPLDDASGALAAIPAFPALAEQALIWTAGARPAPRDVNASPGDSLKALLHAALWLVLLAAFAAELFDPLLRAAAPAARLSRDPARC